MAIVSYASPPSDADVTLAPVCSFCDCRLIPLANAANAAKVPVLTVESEEWTQYSMRNTTTLPFELFFQSADASCRVEIKLTALKTGESGGILVFPFGRQNLTVAQLALDNVPYICGPTYLAPLVRLGNSALSAGSEVGLQVIVSQNSDLTDVLLELVYRKWCGSSLPAIARGFELPPIPEDGSMQTVVPFANQTQLDWSGLARITWETASSSNCALEIAFHRAPLYTYLNQIVRVIPWMVYKVPTGVGAFIEVTGLLATGERDLLEISYWAVDCNTAKVSSEIEIISWNDSLVPLDYSMAWRNVTRIASIAVTAPRQVDLAVFFAAAPNWPIETLPLIYRTPEFAGSPSGDWPSDFYQREFNRTFGTQLLKDSVPIVLFFETHHWAPGDTAVEAFCYRAVARSRAIQAQSSTEAASWESIVYSADNATSLFLDFRPNDVSCFVQVDVTFPTGGWAPSTCFLDPSGTSGRTTSHDVNNIVQSLTGSLVIQLDYTILSAKPKISFRQVCPDTLEAPNGGNWSYNNVSVDEHPVFVLPQLAASPGRNCRYQISGLGMRIAIMSDIQVMCLAWDQAPGLNQRSLALYATLSPMQSIDLANCSHGGNGTSIYVQAAPGWSLFGYRMVCEGDLGENSSTAPYPATIGSVLQATGEKWWKLNFSNPDLPLTVVASNQNCQVEMEFGWVDLFNVAIYEDFVHPDDSGNDPRFFKYIPGFDDYTNWAPFPNVRYLSCTSRVIFKTNRVGWPTPEYVQVFDTNSRFRQVCNLPKPEACAQDISFNVSNTEWRTLQGSAVNPNQMTHTTYHLYPMFTTDDQVLQVEFTSLVSQVWVGVVPTRYETYSERETHYGVVIDRQYPAMTGKQFLFKHNITLAPDALFNIKPGGHWFTMRYRIVPFEIAKLERDLGDVLVAKDKAQELAFHIPKQFSQEAARRAVVNDHLDDDYKSAGEFNVWAFKHRYTIRPASPECRVVLRFKKIDIGSGHVSRNPHAGIEQSRLSVVRDSIWLKSRASKACSSSLKNNFTKNHWTEPICARLGQTYTTPRPNASLVIFFRSAKIYEEYEYETQPEVPNYPKEYKMFEKTWGSGWTATYRQVCSEQRIMQSLYPTPVVLKAKNKWQLFRPSMPAHSSESNTATLLSFLDKRWRIVPDHPSHCRVRMLVKNHFVRTLATLSKDNKFRLLAANAQLDSHEIMLILTRDVYAHDFPNVRYMQVCS